MLLQNASKPVLKLIVPPITPREMELPSPHPVDSKKRTALEESDDNIRNKQVKIGKDEGIM